MYGTKRYSHRYIRTPLSIGPRLCQLRRIKGEANAYLSHPSYNALRLRLEMAHAAVEARRQVRLDEGRHR
jgi:hypothetical protein